jgi:glycosyltransferase 2 family protein
VLLATYAIYRDRQPFADALRSIGPVAIVVSFLAGVVGVALTYPVWRAILGGLDVDMPFAIGGRVFFTSQLGKYLPGSVWPVVMQMEAGKARGASRRTMLVANLMTLAVSCCVGLLLACVLLSVFDSSALAHYWWALLAVPFLVALLHPRALTGIIDWGFSLIHRPPLGETLPVGATVRAAGWNALSWIFIGLQLGILCNGVSHGGAKDFLVAIGAMALAVPVGVLFIPAPAGAGIRDVVLALVLTVVLTSAEALAVVVASRVLLMGCDLLLAGLVNLHRRRKPVHP